MHHHNEGPSRIFFGLAFIALLFWAGGKLWPHSSRLDALVNEGRERADLLYRSQFSHGQEERILANSLDA